MSSGSLNHNLATCGEDIKMWAIQGTKGKWRQNLQQTWKPHDKGVNVMRWNSNKRIMASGGANGDVKLYTYPDTQPLFTFPGDNRPINALAFSSGSRYLACGGGQVANGSFVVTVWDLKKKTRNSKVYRTYKRSYSCRIQC